VAISDLAPVTPATSGNISAANFGNSYALIDLTQQEQALANRIATQGDLKGVNTETLVESVAQRQGLTSLPGGKYGSNNGFDHVFENADGSVTIVLDSKQVNNGAAKLSEGAGGQLQLTDAWVQAVLDRLDANSPAHIAVSRALQDGTLTKGVAGVDKSTGKLVIVRIN
jgi:filamentous hemagglutinin